jgi:hypothetical protein
MESFSCRGGARIGLKNATRPFAVLKFKDGVLNLNSSVFANLYFANEDIISFEPRGEGYDKGVRINHKVETYKEEVIFWTSCDPEELADKLRSGFLSNAQPVDYSKVRALQAGGGKVFKGHAIWLWILAILLYIPAAYAFFIPVIHPQIKELSLFKSIAFNIVWLYVSLTLTCLIYSIKVRKFLFRNGIEEDIDNQFLGMMAIIFGILFMVFVAGRV